MDPNTKMKQEGNVEDKITPENCSNKLKLIRENASISRGELAKILGVPESTILRIEDKKKKNIPRNDFLNRLRAIQVLGYAKYSDLSSSEKKYSADLMTGKLLTVRGVTCGLYVLGSVGFTDINITLNNIPIGQLGYGIIKSLDMVCKKNQLIGREKNGQLMISKKDESGLNILYVKHKKRKQIKQNTLYKLLKMIATKDPEASAAVEADAEAAMQEIIEAAVQVAVKAAAKASAQAAAEAQAVDDASALESDEKNSKNK